MNALQPRKTGGEWFPCSLEPGMGQSKWGRFFEVYLLIESQVAPIDRAVVHR
jgi:hypothetical protein